MRKPAASSHFSAYLRYGAHVEQALRRSGMPGEAERARAVTEQVKLAGREWEDLGSPPSRARADRSIADEALDRSAREVHHSLLSRDLDAREKEPFLAIFPQGLVRYVKAALGDQIKTYQELQQRLASALSPEDELLKVYGPRLSAELAEWQQAADRVAAADTEERMARERLKQAEAAWNAEQDSLYAQAVAQLGKTRAERCFPKP